MKLTTLIWAQMESKGRPVHTRRINDSVSRVILEFAKWMGEAYMGANIRLTIARTEGELEVALSRKTTNAPDEDMMSELVALLDIHDTYQDGFNDGDIFVRQDGITRYFRDPNGSEYGVEPESTGCEATTGLRAAQSELEI